MNSKSDNTLKENGKENSVNNPVSFGRGCGPRLSCFLCPLLKLWPHSLDVGSCTAHYL